SYEPKWDGFRALAFRDRDEVVLQSRNGKELGRYFPELFEALRDELAERCVLDGEVVVPREIDGRMRLDWESLSQRIHPAESRVRMLSEQTPAHFIGFDALATGDRSLLAEPFRVRREALIEAVRSKVWCHVTPATTDLPTARRWFDEFEGAGLDGLIAKPLTLTYQPDKRVMVKIKHQRTADCVVAGYRLHKSGPDAVGSLLLGLYTDDGELASVGVIGAFPMDRRRALFTEL
ncbi:ATP-dependent DNA ligase, partial [Mycolicibacterium conceptionense]|uniref:ATP-dependent DNA ligase n=2 Tax=Mycolicibacterium conceptionense TaxID=451644 RepID=UPI0007ECF557